MLFNLFVEQRLGDGGVVNLTVAVAAIADEIDDDVGAELVAVFDRHAGDAHDRIYVFAIHVENGNGLAAGDAGGEARGVLFVIVRGESEKIIDDDVDGAADGVALEIGVVHGLGEDALSGERGITVDEQGQIFFGSAFASTVLLGASAAYRNGIDSFEMAGIRNQVDVNFPAAARNVFAGGAHVVLNVSAAKNAAGIDVFKTGEDFFGGAARYMGDYVEAPAMAHAHDQFDCASLGGRVENFVDQGQKRGDALEGEALAAKIPLLQNQLEQVGTDQQVENALLIFLLMFGFHALVDPVTAFGIGDVVDLDTNGAGVNGAGFAGVLTFDLQ